MAAEKARHFLQNSSRVRVGNQHQLPLVRLPHTAILHVLTPKTLPKLQILGLSFYTHANTQSMRQTQREHMQDVEKQSALEHQSFGKRLKSSLPGILLFSVLCYVSVDVIGFRIRFSVPFWLRLPFFLYYCLTVFVGLQVAFQLFPTSRTIESLRSTTMQFIG